jgi:GAF domain-containing protein
VIVIASFQKLPNLFRTLSFIGLIYAVGVTSFLQGGMTTDGAVFLLAFAAMATLLVGPWGAIGSAALGLITMVAMGTLMSMHIIVPQEMALSDDPSQWISRGAVFALLSILIAASLNTMLRGLQKNLEKATFIARELEKDQVSLQKQTQETERRSQEIRATAEISRAISRVLSPQMLFQESVDLILKRFNLYYVGIFIVDETSRSAILQAGTGEAGKAMLAERHRLSIAESSMIGWTIIHRQARIALDVGQDAIRFANPYLPDTHSELALPLLSGDQVFGALSIQSNQREAFDQDDITILQNIADTLAIALENARLFQEAQSTLDELRVAQRAYITKTWSETAREHEKFEYSSGGPAPVQGSETSSIDVPLTLREQIIGELHLEGDQDWTPEERSLIEAVASQAALAMENARLLEESQTSALRERLVAEITGKVWSSPNADFILQTAVKELARALRTDDAVIELKLD